MWPKTDARCQGAILRVAGALVLLSTFLTSSVSHALPQFLGDLDEDGVPTLSITGEAKKILDKSGADRLHLSISHTAEHAAANVILEKT